MKPVNDMLRRTVAYKASLLFCVSLCSASSLAQAVKVSLKLNVTQAASGPKHSMKAMPGTNSGDVVAWLTPLDSSRQLPHHAAPSHGYRLVQKDKEFTPHLVVVPTGTSIDFPNEDPFFHNVFSLFNGKRFDLGLYEAGSHRSVRFDREGVSYIFCNIHPEMGAVVISLSTPYYAVSSKDGTVEIDDVPSGEYTLTLWAEGVSAADLSASSRTVRVNNESTLLGTISLTRKTSAMEHKNKFGEDYKPPSTKPY